MSRLRSLLLCLLMLALPFQGFAAAAMVACGLPQAPVAQAEAHRHAHEQHATGNHDAAQHHHEAQASDPQDAQHKHAASGLDHKCGACSVCHAAALLDTPLNSQPHALPQASPSMGQAAIATLAPRLPDKPPRA